MGIFGLFSASKANNLEGDEGNRENGGQNEAERMKTISRIQDPALRQQIGRLRSQIDKNKEAGKTQREKYEELVKLNNIVTEGYKHNLNVIIEISQLLIDYRLFVEEIANSMQDMGANADGLSELVTVQDLGHLKELTSDKLSSVANDFEKQIGQIKKVTQENGRETAELENAQRILNRLADDKTQKAIRNQIEVNQTGAGKGRGRGGGKGTGSGSGSGTGTGTGSVAGTGRGRGKGTGRERGKGRGRGRGSNC